MDVQEDILRQLTRLPRPGKPAAELTDRDKVAIGLALGLPYTTRMEGGRFTVTLAQPIGVADRGDGGYIVGVGRA